MLVTIKGLRQVGGWPVTFSISTLYMTAPPRPLSHSDVTMLVTIKGLRQGGGGPVTLSISTLSIRQLRLVLSLTLTDYKGTETWRRLASNIPISTLYMTAPPRLLAHCDVNMLVTVKGLRHERGGPITLSIRQLRLVLSLTVT
ncbi:hypothetical protein J6590_004864 [Homalodisca vitripennis]|nr:hypothetical protein J6590_004864 [Homalodisca vitripennis]